MRNMSWCCQAFLGSSMGWAAQWWNTLSLMPFIRSFIFKRYAFLAISISLNKEIISLYFYYIKKGLVCIIIIKPFGY